MLIENFNSIIQKRIESGIYTIWEQFQVLKKLRKVLFGTINSNFVMNLMVC